MGVDIVIGWVVWMMMMMMSAVEYLLTFLILLDEGRMMMMMTKAEVRSYSRSAFGRVDLLQPLSNDRCHLMFPLIQCVSDLRYLFVFSKLRYFSHGLLEIALHRILTDGCTRTIFALRVTIQVVV